MRSLLLVTGLLVALSACVTTVDNPDDDSGQGGAGASGGGTPSDNCTVPDTSCPDAMPFPGAPCQGDLSCPYDDSAAPWLFTCEGGKWDGEQDCGMIVGGACNVTPAAEGCGDAFTGDLTADVAVGPVEAGQAFREFTAGEEAEFVWGGQGAAMIYFRLRIDSDDAPGCVVVNTTVAAAGMTPLTAKTSVRLRCGESLRMYVVLPDDDCPSGLVDTVLTVEVEGVGTREITLSVPGEAFCTAFG